MKITKLISSLSLESLGLLGFGGLQKISVEYCDRSPPVPQRFRK
jgi:hypothetical protein